MPCLELTVVLPTIPTIVAIILGGTIQPQINIGFDCCCEFNLSIAFPPINIELIIPFPSELSAAILVINLDILAAQTIINEIMILPCPLNGSLEVT
jgi:hypothetical protein